MTILQAKNIICSHKGGLRMNLMNLVSGCPVTFATILICAIVYFRQNSDPSFTGKYLNNSYMIQQGQYYRLLTGGFLHGSPWHIMMNLYSLYNLGPWMERMLGPAKFLLLLYGGVLIGNLFCYFFKVRSSLGLSGGLYAVMFFYFMLLTSYTTVSWASILQNNIANIIINFMPGVAWQAHLGGALFGVLMSFLF